MNKQNYCNHNFLDFDKNYELLKKNIICTHVQKIYSKNKFITEFFNIQN